MRSGDCARRQRTRVRDERVAVTLHDVSLSEALARVARGECFDDPSRMRGWKE